jgi:hypothetical protein
MTFLRIGSKLINLDRVSSIDLEDEAPLTSPTTPPRVSVVVGRHRHVFKAERAEALRAYFDDPMTYNTRSGGWYGLNIVDLTPVAELAEVGTEGKGR